MYVYKKGIIYVHVLFEHHDYIVGTDIFYIDEVPLKVFKYLDKI